MSSVSVCSRMRCSWRSVEQKYVPVWVRTDVCMYVRAMHSDTWKKGKDPHPQDKIQHLDLTKAPRPLYYKTPPCVFTTKMSIVRPFSVLSKDEIGP